MIAQSTLALLFMSFLQYIISATASVTSFLVELPRNRIGNAPSEGEFVVLNCKHSDPFVATRFGYVNNVENLSKRNKMEAIHRKYRKFV